MPYRKGVANYWRDFKHRYRLTGSRCNNCGEVYYPPKKICKKCGQETEEYVFSGNGEIVSYTIIRSSPSGFEKSSPYVLALIKLEEGPALTGMVVDGSEENVKVGSKVKPVFRKISENGRRDIIHYGLKFKVVE